MQSITGLSESVYALYVLNKALKDKISPIWTSFHNSLSNNRKEIQSLLTEIELINFERIRLPDASSYPMLGIDLFKVCDGLCLCI